MLFSIDIEAVPGVKNAKKRFLAFFTGDCRRSIDDKIFIFSAKLFFLRDLSIPQVFELLTEK